MLEFSSTVLPAPSPYHHKNYTETERKLKSRSITSGTYYTMHTGVFHESAAVNKIKPRAGLMIDSC